MTAISSTNCGNYSSGTFHITHYCGSYEVGQVGRCISVCIASFAYRSATPWYMTVTAVIIVWVCKTPMWLRRVCCMSWFCGWWPKKLIITLLKQLLVSQIVQSVIRTYYWTLSCLRLTLLYSALTRRPSIGLPSDYLIKVWSAFLIPSCLPHVVRISCHLWLCQFRPP